MSENSFPPRLEKLLHDDVAGSADDVQNLEVETGGKFMDLRVGLFMVDSVTAHTLSRGWSLLQWKKTLNFCSKCGSPLGKV